MIAMNKFMIFKDTGLDKDGKGVKIEKSVQGTEYDTKSERRRKNLKKAEKKIMKVGKTRQLTHLETL